MSKSVERGAGVNDAEDRSRTGLQISEAPRHRV